MFIRSQAYTRFLAGALSLSLLLACESTPTTAPIPAKPVSPALQASAKPVPETLKPRTLKLKFKLSAALLSGFKTQQSTESCAQAMTNISTRLSLTGLLSSAAKAQLEAQDITVEDIAGQSTLVFSNSIQELNANQLELEYTIEDLPAGFAQGQTTFKDNLDQELGFVSYSTSIQLDSATEVTMLLTGTTEASGLATCPQLEAKLTGATLGATGGDIIPAPATTPTPNATPTPTPTPVITAVQPVLNSISTTSGYPATRVVISGSGFLGTTSVTFGDVAAHAFSVESDLEIIAFSSSVAPVAGTIKVINPAGEAESSQSFTPTIGQRTIYAKPGATGQGNSWNDAQELVFAMAAAQPGDEVWVAAGRYVPELYPGDRSYSFELKSNVGVYGGFNGSEGSRGARDPEANLTILSGDVSGDDNHTDNDLTDISENIYHVVVANNVNDAILDGFTIEGGSAAGTVPDDRGAGLLHINSTTLVENVQFSNNIAKYAGGAIYNIGSGSVLTLRNSNLSVNAAGFSGGGINNVKSNAILKNVTLTQNSSKQGGGIFNDGASPSLSQVTLDQNVALYNGGSIHNRKNSSPTLSDVTISNSQAASGAGLYNVDQSSPQLLRVKIKNNDADNGAGIYNYQNSSPRLEQVTLTSNIAKFLGGGIYNYQSSSPIMERVTIVSNAAKEGGGIYNRSYSNPQITNAVFHNNVATNGNGGAIYNYNGSSPKLLHITSYNNLASAGIGAEIFSSLRSSPSLTSSVIWNDGANPLFQDQDGDILINSSTVKDFSNILNTSGIGNINLDPAFVDPANAAGADGIYMTGDDGLRLSETSPARNFGKSSTMPATDILGAIRIAAPEQGAYEGEFSAVLGTLVSEDLQTGSGALAEVGDTLTIHYVGTLTNGDEFDNSRTGSPFSFTLGAGQVIQGWEQGIPGMREGGIRKLTIPPHLAYGAQWIGQILPNSTLIFEIELISVQKN